MLQRVFLKKSDPSGKLFSGVPDDMENLIKDRNKSFIGIIENVQGLHYVAWVTRGGFWYRIDSMFKYYKSPGVCEGSNQLGITTYGTTSQKLGDAGHICKYTEENMIKYLTRGESGYSPCSNLIIVSAEKYFDNSGNLIGTSSGAGAGSSASPLKLKRKKYLSPTSKIKMARKKRKSNIQKLKVKK